MRFAELAPETQAVIRAKQAAKKRARKTQREQSRLKDKAGASAVATATSVAAVAAGVGSPLLLLRYEEMPTRIHRKRCDVGVTVRVATTTNGNGAQPVTVGTKHLQGAAISNYGGAVSKSYHSSRTAKLVRA